MGGGVARGSNQKIPQARSEKERVWTWGGLPLPPRRPAKAEACPSRKADLCSPTSRKKAVGAVSARPQPGGARLEKLQERLESGQETDLQSGVRRGTRQGGDTGPAIGKRKSPPHAPTSKLGWLTRIRSLLSLGLIPRLSGKGFASGDQVACEAFWL